MKKVYFLFISILLFIPFLYAQGDKDTVNHSMSVKEQAKSITNKMISELNLHEEQIQPIDSINIRFIEAEQILKKKMNQDKELLKNALKALSEEKIYALSLILSTKQLKDYKKKLHDKK